MSNNINNVATNRDTALHVMKEKDMSQVNKTAKVMKVLGYIAVYAFLFLMAIIVLFPFYWMIISSLKSWQEYNRAVPTLWPEVIHFDNYAVALERANLEKVFGNTVFVFLFLVFKVILFVYSEGKGKINLTFCPTFL